MNVRTLKDRMNADKPMKRTALVGSELARYDVDIAAMCETRLDDECQITEKGLATHSSGVCEVQRIYERLESGCRPKLTSSTNLPAYQADKTTDS